MRQGLQREIVKLKKRILTLSALVEDRVREAVKSIEERDPEIAREVIEGDLEIDQMEIDLEEECLKILALYQPVANDLRFIIAMLRVNSDLERIGDLSVNIAESAVSLSMRRRIPIPIDLATMFSKVQAMLRKSLDSLVNTDVEGAYEVCIADDEVDKIYHQMEKTVSDGMQHYPDRAACLVEVLEVSMFLERIADHATNISEDVIYMIEGEIIRHKKSLEEADSEQT